jgi:hypothetical protein
LAINSKKIEQDKLGGNKIKKDKKERKYCLHMNIRYEMSLKRVRRSDGTGYDAL